MKAAFVFVFVVALGVLSFQLGRLDAAMLPRPTTVEPIMIPGQTCPNPNPVKYVNSDIIKDCEFGDHCRFVSRFDYQREVRHLLSRVKRQSTTTGATE